MPFLLLLAALFASAPPAAPPAGAPPAGAPPAGAPLAATAEFPAPDCSLVAGFSRQGEPRRFDPETLFEYKDGGAEAYFVYGFTLMKGVTCADGSGHELAIDVSELGDPDLAWGFFAANQDPAAATEAVGSARQILPSSALLAVGRYYAEITASPDGDHAASLRAFMDALLPRLPGAPHVPEAVSFFPPEGLERGSVRLVPESVLGLRVLRSGFVAQYGLGRAFVVTETGVERAREALAELRARFEAEASASEAPPVKPLGAAGPGEGAFRAQDPYLGGLVVFRKGRHVAGVANVPDGRDALPLAKALALRLPE